MKCLFEIDGEYDEEVMLLALTRAFPKERFIKITKMESFKEKLFIDKNNLAEVCKQDFN